MDSRDAMMDDRDDHGRDDDRKRNSKRGPEGSQRTGSPPRREGAVSVTKPQNKGPRKSTGKARGRHKTGAKLDADAQGAALAFGGDEAQGPPDTSRTADVPVREDDDDDAFPLGGQSADDRRTSAQFEAALPDTSMDMKEDARPEAAAASFVAPPAQAPAPPPPTTVVNAAGGGVSAVRAVRALAPVPNTAPSAETSVDAFLASPTDATAAALLATVRVPSVDDADGRNMYATFSRLVTMKVAGTLRCTGTTSLTSILRDAGLTKEHVGLASNNMKLVRRFMDPAELAKKERKATRKRQEFSAALGFPAWLRAALVRLVEMLASREAGVVAERKKAEAEAKWVDRVAAAKASRAALNARGEDGDAVKVLESLLKSATDLQASGRLCCSAVKALQEEAERYFPYGAWYHNELAGFQRSLIEYAARKPAAEELTAMLDALDEKQSARMDDSAATWNRVHAKQLAAVEDTAVVGARPTRLEPEWDEAGRLRARDERAAEESAPRSKMGCDLGTLHPRHNAAVDASIDESGELPRRSLKKGELAEKQMFFAARDVPKPRSPEEMVRNYRHSTGWNGKEWVEGAGAGEASRARAAARRAGGPAAESDEDVDPGL